ncbi:MAG: site-specific integrase, partial [Oleiharenicola lentus]
MKTVRSPRKSEAPPAPVPPGFADAIDDFLAYIELEKGLARNTAKSYETDLRQAAHCLKR